MSINQEAGELAYWGYDEELKPCPFCGGRELLVDKYEHYQAFVQCRSCGAEVSGCEIEDVLDHWQRRVE